MNARGKRPVPRDPQDQGLSLPGYGLDLEVRPSPLSARHREVVCALAAEGVSSFLGRMTATKLAERPLN